MEYDAVLGMADEVADKPAAEDKAGAEDKVSSEDKVSAAEDKPSAEIKNSGVVYNPEKDFYRGIGGEFRLKAEGLFKKAKEKLISIEEINITTLRENKVDFPGIGTVELPAFLVTVKGRDIQNGQVITDGKQIDYYNRYQRYVADRLRKKIFAGDAEEETEPGDIRQKAGDAFEMSLTDRERLEIGKDLLGDKEFGLEKTITGACDRVIRKLMGENDWLYPEEARLLDEEFEIVRKAIEKERDKRRQIAPGQQKKATERQINYLKAKIRNLGLDSENEHVVREVVRQAGFGSTDLSELTTGEMSRIIDSVNEIIPRVRNVLAKKSREVERGFEEGKGELH